MGNTKRYWSDLEELEKTEAYQEAVKEEFPGQPSVDEFLGDDRLNETSTGRRDFLKFMGFSITAATLAACETPVIKSVPYVNKPEEITPGIANYYASTYYDGNDYGSLLVKTREGRPIFIKGNRDHGIAKGALNARINASVLGLYDSARLQGPMMGGSAASWSDADKAVMDGLSSARRVVLLSNTVVSPSTQRAIDVFKAKYNASHVQYDAISYSGMREANRMTMGQAIIPTYKFDNAKVVVSIGADFLANWLTSNLYAPDYAMRRKPEGEWMSRHFQFEGQMSLTGTNADTRVQIKPDQEGKVAAAILAGLTGGNASVEGVAEMALNNAVNALKANKGASLVVAGSNDPDVQRIVNAINNELGNYGVTIDTATPINMFQGNDKAFADLVRDMKGGQVDALVVYGANPGYSWASSSEFTEGLAKVKMSVAMNGLADETASKCSVICPDNHWLESWNDLSLTAGRVDLVQPTITPLFNTRAAQESLLKWAGMDMDYYTFLRQTYNPAYGAAGMYTDQDWNKAVHNGMMVQAAAAAPAVEAVDTAAEEAPAAVASMNVADAVSNVKKENGGNWQVFLYQKTGIGDGSHIANPWCQELPDPVTKVTWDNYVTMSFADMEAMGMSLKLGQRDPASVVRVTANGSTVELPVFPQPGQKPGTIGIALGYGRGAGNEKIGRAAFETKENGEHVKDENGNMKPVGANVFPFVTMKNGFPVYNNTDVAIEQVEGGEYNLASTQMHSTYMGRDSVVKETTIGAYLAEKSKAKGEASWNKKHALNVHRDVNGDGKIDSSDKVGISEFDMWHEHPVEGVGHRWGMTVDLSSCLGCGACVTACHIENNVPVVGKDEVHRHRDMHWLRIDRFYSSDYSLERGEEEGVGVIDSYGRMERPGDNPQTVHMPMMCQHCNHAPCETVCPVAATTHSNEGLNQMTYNRCIGTRYCANNCPYKVRRFNWFNYMGYDKFKNVNPSQDMLTRMVLNPDVTVRARGVMEKCSMCVQRIQAGKLEAKKNSTPVADGDVVTACAEACSVGAIKFGDLNDKKSEVRETSENNRAYHALEEVGVKPNIFYMTKVRNIEEEA
ncbi:MAG: TAT-variant-translocated molybdopterin oxidoreductase [Flavobacteriales bacterium]|nr:TAT-variant-translocated molybdopterin oxidoreductase [Flavobacteriales bacterium]